MLETLEAVRHVWPENLPLTARFGVIEYDGRDEETLAESIEVTRQMRANGLGSAERQHRLLHPGRQYSVGPGVPCADRRARAPGSADSGRFRTGIDAPAIANRTVEEQQLDSVMVGRAHWRTRTGRIRPRWR